MIELRFDFERNKKMNVILNSDDAHILVTLVSAQILDHVDLSPEGIKNHLKLDQPIYEATSTYGHFGRDYVSNTGSFSWEKLDLAEKLLNEL